MATRSVAKARRPPTPIFKPSTRLAPIIAPDSPPTPAYDRLEDILANETHADKQPRTPCNTPSTQQDDQRVPQGNHGPLDLTDTKVEIDQTPVSPAAQQAHSEDADTPFPIPEADQSDSSHELISNADTREPILSADSPVADDDASYSPSQDGLSQSEDEDSDARSNTRGREVKNTDELKQLSAELGIEEEEQS